MAMSNQLTDNSHFSEVSSLPSKSLFSVKVAGPVSCIAIAPSCPDILAIDCIDSILLRSSAAFTLLKCFSSLKQCVSYVEWHPTKSNIIAFGCISGKVGFIETDRNTTQAPHYFEEDHRTIVYSLAWGPCSKLSESSEVNQEHMFLYSCGGGKILIHDINKLDESFSLEDILDNSKTPYYTEFTWKPDFSQFAVGCKDGSLSIYDQNTCNLLFKLKDIKGGIWSTRWHPKFLLPNSVTRSKYHNVIAVGTPEDIVHIYVVNAKKGTVDGGTRMKPTKLLKGHNGPINKLDWSPFIEGRLATCSKDASVQIWDVNKGDLIANFQGHERNVLAVRWSLEDPDVVFSAGRDHRLICWRPSEQTETRPPERLPMLDRRRRKGGSTFKDADDFVVFNSKKDLMERTVPAKNKQGEVTKEKNVLTTKSANSEAMNSVKETTRGRRQLKNEKKVNKISEVTNLDFTVPVDTSEIDDQIIEDVLKEFEELTNRGKPIDDGIVEQIEDKKCFFDENPLSVLARFFPDEDLCKIFYAAQSFKKTVDPIYVAIAPMVSMCNWKKCCIAHSKVNFESSRNDIAAFYALIVGDVATAMSILLRDNVHRVMECYFIAKYYCEKKDPLIQEYWEHLHKDLHYQKAFEIRSLLYLSVGDVLKAASILTEHKEPIFAKVAADICYKNSFLAEAKKYEALCLKRCLVSQDYTTFNELESKQNFEWIVTVHKMLSKALESLDVSEPLFGMQWKNIGKMKGSKIVLWKSYAMNNSNFFTYVFQALGETSPLDFKNDEFCKAFRYFKSEMGAPANVISSEELVFYATLYICDFFYILHTRNAKENIEKAFIALSKVLALCYSRRTVELLNKMCILLLPFDIVWDKELLNFEFQDWGKNSSEDMVSDTFQYLVKSIVDKDIIKLVMDSPVSQFNLHALTKELLCVNASDIVLTYFAINLVINCIKNNETCFYYFNFRQIQLSHVVKHLLECSHHKTGSESSVHHSEIPPVPNGDLNQTSPANTATNGHISDVNDNDSDDVYVNIDKKDEFQTIALGKLTVTIIKDFPIASSDLEFVDNSEHNKGLMCEFCGTSSSFTIPDSSQCSCDERFSFFFSLLSVVIKLTCKNIFKVNPYSKKKFLPKLRRISEAENDGNSADTSDFTQTIESDDYFESKFPTIFKAVNIVDQVQQFPDIHSMATFLKTFIGECDNSCCCEGMKLKLKSLHKYIDDFISC